MKHEGSTHKTPVQRPRWPELVKRVRKQLGESQTEFGARFGVSHAAVSDWERGVSEPPATVTWWLVEQGAVSDDQK